MRLGNVLFRQHIDRMFKKHWRVQGQRVLIDTGAESHLKSLGITVLDPKDVVKDSRKPMKIDVIGLNPKPTRHDFTHPEWNDQVCYFHRNDNVLLLGIDQAKFITRTVELQDGLPECLKHLPNPTSDINNRVKRMILASLLFDAEQNKLPIVKDLNRPAWNFPRTLGITHNRICQLIISKLLQICESTSDKAMANQRKILKDAQFFVPLKRGEDNIMLELGADQLLMSKKPLSRFTEGNGDDVRLPNLHPVHHTVTLVPENVYQLKDLYPVYGSGMNYHPHTVLVNLDTSRVKNEYEEEVAETQLLGRTLMKTFAVAASYARQKYGKDVKILPEPVSLQCVHTDGRMFHFGCLQLNTLDLDNGAVQNIWYSLPRVQLFSSCQYALGKPTLDGYNPDVVKYMLGFYRNM